MEKVQGWNKNPEKVLSILLKRLGKNVFSDSEIRSSVYEIIRLYNDNGEYFYISYGIVSGIVTELYKNNEKSYIDQILYNLSSIISYVAEEIGKVKFGEKNRYYQAYQGLLKLQDFVSIEAIRVDQVKRELRSAEVEAEKTLKKSNDVNADAKKTLDEARNISEQAKNLKTDVISILAIFAAIILAFTGGLSIFGGAIAGIKDVSFFRLLLVIDFCIIGLFNTMYLLLYVVSRMAGKDISAECEHGECKECGRKGLCKGLERFSKRAPYVMGFNVFLIIMGVVVIILHICGVIH